MAAESKAISADSATTNFRTHLAGTLGEDLMGQEVRLAGWVRRRRDHGGLIFVDLADYTGICQIVFTPERKELFEAAERLRSEFVISVRGQVRKRPDESINANIPTGMVEVEVLEGELLSEAETPPFLIQDPTDAKEELRLKHRYLDLRRPRMQEILRTRHDVCQSTRTYLNNKSFCELETPILTKPTPEGARDFLVPSRMSRGHFYALPQSPQLFKQVLMVSSFDRYYQIVRCFRDEDFRANRQPEFTQIDIEMSFVNELDIQNLVEGLMSAIWKDCAGIELDTPFPRMSYDDAMDRYGVDAPDLRFGLELQDVSSVFAKSSFQVFESTLSEGGIIKALRLPKAADQLSRKDMDELTDFVKGYGAKGLVWMKREADGLKSPITKFLTEDELSGLQSALGVEQGDVVFAVAAAPALTNASLGALRLQLGKRFSLIDESQLAFCWVEDFPLLEFDPESGRYIAVHHPFTSPQFESEADLEAIVQNPEKARARAYDLVLNGQEVAGGSIRIHRADIQRRVFSLLGLSEEEARAKFGFLLDAFQYGAPPHGGIAVGLDRLIMILTGTDSIREVIAFPKTARGLDAMVGAPSLTDVEQLVELGIQVLKE